MAKKILIVDDNIMNLKVAEMILQQKGYEVDIAESGVQCLEILQTKTYDLVLLDVEMPEMSGLEVLEKIRNTDELKDLKVVFITADAEEDIMQAAKNLGAIDYIEKPFILPELQKRVEDIVGV